MKTNQEFESNFIIDLLIDNKEKELMQDKELVAALVTISNKSKNKIETYSKILNRAKHKIFTKSKIKKLGDISKAVEDKELQKILQFENNDAIKIAYLFMFSMGLRVNEAVVIQKKDILNGKLIIKNKKCSRHDIRTIPKNILDQVTKYMINYEITHQDDYLIKSNNPVQIREHLSENWLRNHFRKTTLELGINKIYGYSNEPKSHVKENGKIVHRASRPLYIYSSHSGRHSFCMKFYTACGYDPEKTRIAMRLSSLKQLQHYLKGSTEEVDRIMLNMS